MLATERMKLAHGLIPPEDKVDLVLGVHYTLLSRVKSSDENYVTVLDKYRLNIYVGKTTKIII